MGDESGAAAFGAERADILIEVSGVSHLLAVYRASLCLESDSRSILKADSREATEPVGSIPAGLKRSFKIKPGKFAWYSDWHLQNVFYPKTT